MEKPREILDRWAIREYLYIFPATFTDIAKHCPLQAPALLIGSSIRSLAKHFSQSTYESYNHPFQDLDCLVPSQALENLTEEFKVVPLSSRSCPSIQILTVSPQKLFDCGKNFGSRKTTLQIISVPPTVSPTKFLDLTGIPNEKTHAIILPDGSLKIVPEKVGTPTDLQFLSSESQELVGLIYTAKSLIRHALINPKLSTNLLEVSQLSDQLSNNLAWNKFSPLQLESMTDYYFKNCARDAFNETETIGLSILRTGVFKLIIRGLFESYHMPDEIRLCLLYHTYNYIIEALINCPNPNLDLLTKIFKGRSTQITPEELISGLDYLVQKYSGTDFQTLQVQPKTATFSTHQFLHSLIPERPTQYRADHLVWFQDYPLTH